MAQPATSAKIEELRFRVKTDPKSRLFYPLAEELRKAGQLDEAEQVLRTGLVAHPTYLSAWVSLGRVLRDQKNDGAAVEPLAKALQLDPGNVVAARLLADAYLSLGEKVEAIKKYKLVHALLPADESLEATIAALEAELRPPPQPDIVVAEVPAPTTDETSASAHVQPEPEEPLFAESDTGEASPFADEGDSPFDRTMPPFAEAARELGEESRLEEATGDAEPMSAAHEESPFEEPVGTYTAASLQVEEPLGMHIAAAPVAAEVPSPVMDEEELPPVEAPLPAAVPVIDAPAVAEEADVFAPDAGEEAAASLQPQRPHGPSRARIARLENWLAKVSRREVGSV